jgi:hypothetical protein
MSVTVLYFNAVKILLFEVKELGPFLLFNPLCRYPKGAGFYLQEKKEKKILLPPFL